MFAKKEAPAIDLKRALKSDASQSAYATPSFAMKDMRQSARKDLWCECSLTAFGAEVREAVITDISKKGARVRFRRRGSLPDIVHIKASRVGLNRMARVAWQTMFDAGLEFYEPGEKPALKPASQTHGAKKKPGFGKKTS
jgi:hypothetical protein